MDAFWDFLSTTWSNASDLGWWHDNNPAYLIFGFGGSNPVNLALSTMLVLVMAMCLAGSLQRLRLAIYLGFHMVVALGFMFAIQSLADTYLSPIGGITPNIGSAIVAVTAAVVALVNIVGAFGAYRWLEAKFVRDQKIVPLNRPSVRVFRASGYLFVASAFLAMGTGAAGVSTYGWLHWAWLNVDYNAWLAVPLFACTTVVSSYFAFRRHHKANRQRPANRTTTYTQFKEEVGEPGKSQLGNPGNTGGVGSDLTAGFGDHPGGTRSGTITNLGIGRRTPKE